MVFTTLASTARGAPGPGQLGRSQGHHIKQRQHPLYNEIANPPTALALTNARDDAEPSRVALPP